MKSTGEMSIEEWRRFYAEEIRFAASLQSGPLVEALARVPREKFVGPAPWKVASPDAMARAVTGLASGSAYVVVTEARDLYHNVAVAIDPARRLNNGQPSAVASWIDALDLRAGERVYHVGCGVGYYTAILAEVVGPTGSVVASEIDGGLAERAATNLADYANVTVHRGDGAEFDPGECDAILVNAGVTHPHLRWLERLKGGGRMVLPITATMPGTASGQGVVARMVREGEKFAARAITLVAIYSCASARDPQLEAQLAKALGKGMLLRMKSVRVDRHEPGTSCILHREDLCVSAAEAG